MANNLMPPHEESQAQQFLRWLPEWAPTALEAWRQHLACWTRHSSIGVVRSPADGGSPIEFSCNHDGSFLCMRDGTLFVSASQPI